MLRRMSWSNAALTLLLVLVVGLPVAGMLLWAVQYRHGVVIKVGEDGSRRRFVRYDELRTWYKDLGD